MANAFEGLQLTNYMVATTDWINEASGGGTPTYEDFPYRANINFSGVTSDYSADVRLNYSEIKGGLIAPIFNCSSDKVIIYASDIPDNRITIPIIICTKIR